MLRAFVESWGEAIGPFMYLLLLRCVSVIRKREPVPGGQRRSESRPRIAGARKPRWLYVTACKFTIDFSDYLDGLYMSYLLLHLSTMQNKLEASKQRRKHVSMEIRELPTVAVD